MAITAEFANGKIYEGSLRSDRTGEHLYGIVDVDRNEVIIDPRVCVVATLLHELIHRKFPEWSERRVQAAEQRALNAMSQQDIRTWYRRYRRAVKQTRPVDVIN